MNYVGIDLGTTNSAICSYDGESLRLYKSPEQHDVTPSVIFIDKRGNKFVGARAYNNAGRNPGNAALLFKRMMGTSTPIHLSALNATFTPEECSAEILKALYGYLPEEIRNDPSTGTVITVPAAFNQMQKDATKSAADIAGIGKVALMQEPVAAIMSVMRARKNDGMFLVYDLGGGTLDIAIAESIAGRVSLLAHGGIAMCGGRDFDRAIFDNIVKPWLHSHFSLPDDFAIQSKYVSLTRMASLAAEKAKIALSSNAEVLISDPDFDAMAFTDLAGKEIYLDIPFSVPQLDSLIAERVNDSITAARETLAKAQLTPHDIERVVFVGGPTQYKPLRDRVAYELGIAPSTDVNPMTAVAEGAAVFAESIDWSTQSRSRKSTRGAISAGGTFQLTFNYAARTPDIKAKVVAKLGGAALPGSAFQIESMDTGWSSGRVPLSDGAAVEVPLSKPGANAFKVWLFDAKGGPIAIQENRITISRTAATVDAIPSSSSLGIEVRSRVGGRPSLFFLVREGEQLPKKGTERFFADESLKAGAAGAINFKIWEGEIADPITDNRFVGAFKIKGSDFEQGVIAKGAELVCDYEVLDSGYMTINVHVPSIGGSFPSGRNFYSSDDGKINFSDASKRVEEDSTRAQERLSEMATKISDPKLDKAQEKLSSIDTTNLAAADPETTKQAMDSIQEAKRLLALAKRAHLKAIRQLDLDTRIERFEALRQYATPAEISAFENLARTAQRSIDSNSPEFEAHLSDLWEKCFWILWRQDWFVIDRFKWLSSSAHLFPDHDEHTALVAAGAKALQKDDMEELRKVTWSLEAVRYPTGTGDEMLTDSNIVRG